MTAFGTRYWAPLGIQHCAYDSATVRMDPAGGVLLSVGTFSHGQGHHTVYAQLVADELGVKVEDVSFIQGDTQATPYGWGTWGSRSIVAGGGAVVNASRKVKDKMLRIAGHLLEVSPGDLEIAPGEVHIKGVPSKSIAIKDLARAAVFSAWQLPAGEDRVLRPHTTMIAAAHVRQCHSHCGGRSRYRDRKSPHRAVCRGRGLRQSGQPDDRRCSGYRRSRAGYRLSPLRTSPV